MIFVDGDILDETIQTPQGPVRIYAETHVIGKHVVLEEFLLYPKEQPEPLAIGVSKVLAIRRSLLELAHEDGFSDLTVFYHRVGPRRTGRTITHTRKL